MTCINCDSTNTISGLSGWFCLDCGVYFLGEDSSGQFVDRGERIDITPAGKAALEILDTAQAKIVRRGRTLVALSPIAAGEHVWIKEVDYLGGVEGRGWL